MNKTSCVTSKSLFHMSAGRGDDAVEERLTLDGCGLAGMIRLFIRAKIPLESIKKFVVSGPEIFTAKECSEIARRTNVLLSLRVLENVDGVMTVTVPKIVAESISPNLIGECDRLIEFMRSAGAHRGCVIRELMPDETSA